MAIDPNSANWHLDASGISESLEKVLRGAQFKDALQLQSLLKFIVENSIDGHDDALKERIIGMNVFGRKPDYETADDPIVRSRVGQLRRRLEHYYETAGSDGSSVQIVIPHGSYRATFVLRPGTIGGSNESPAMDPHQVATSDGAEEHPEPEAAASVPKVPRRARWRAWGIGAAAACTILLTVWITSANWRKSELDLFWEPIFESQKSVLIYTGTGWVYIPSASYIDRLLSLAPPDEQSLPIEDWHFPPLAEGQVLTAKDVVVDEVGFSGTGEVKASVNLAVLLAAHHRSFTLRSGPDLPFADLQGSPAVLLGAYNNHWSMEMTKDLPFFFDRALRIRERGGNGRVWSIVRVPGTSAPEDYALVSRVLDSRTGSTVISIAGITTCGTQAASEFVTDPAQIRKLASIPRSALERKNLEFVLHTTLVDCTPTSMDIVAVKYW
jgi:hypothetical protein